MATRKKAEPETEQPAAVSEEAAKPATAPKKKIGKLVKKAKQRLPRKEKKLAKKKLAKSAK